MFDTKKLRLAIDRAMTVAKISFNVECMEDKEDELDAAAEYASWAYEHCDSEDEAAQEWLLDTKDNYSETLVQY